MAIVASPVTFAFQGNTYVNKANKQTSVLKQLTDYSGKGSGIFRIQKFVSDIFKTIGLAFSSAYSDGMSKKFVGGWSMLAFARLPEVVDRTYESVAGKAANDDDATAAQKASLSLSLSPREMQRRTSEIADCVFTAACAVRIFVEHSIIGRIMDISGLVGAVPDCSMAVEDLVLSQQLVSDVASQDPIVKNAAKLTRTSAMLGVASKVISLFTAVLGVLCIALATPVTLTLALIGSVLAITTHFFKKNVARELVDFYKFQPPVQPAAQAVDDAAVDQLP